MKRQLTAGTALLIAGAALFAYTVKALYGMPMLCALVLSWVCFVEYAIIRAWWADVQEVRATVRQRRHR